MKLQDRLPDTVQVNGRRIRVDLDFRNVLRMFDILADKGLTPGARETLAARCVTKHPVPGVVMAVRALLTQKESKGAQEHKRVTSFEQDAALIRAAFWQAYGIDLWTAKLHYLQFMELLQGLPDDTQYMNIIGIRSRPMPKPTKYNREERDWLRKAKAQYAIKESEEEKERSYQRDVANVFRGLMSMIPGG